MSKVYTGASMSLDGYIAGPNDTGFEHLFEWYESGDIEVPTTHEELTVRLTPASAKHFTDLVENTGSLIVGRKLFDAMNGWGGEHPLGRTVVVLTHRPAPGWEDNPNYVFVTEGIEAAVAKASEIAGDRVVGVNGGVMASQCLDAGLLDEIWVDLVPVLLGEGTPFFSGLVNRPVSLEGPISVVESNRVTHMRYRVRK